MADEYKIRLEDLTKVMLERWRLFHRPILEHQEKEHEYKQAISDAFFQGFNLGKKVAEAEAELEKRTGAPF